MTRILCIDDETAIIRLLQVVLGQDGYEAIGVSNWQAAKAALAQRDVGAVLLDLGLPDRDGLELIPLIKALSAAPIIVVSARSDISEKVTALDLGAVDYLTKPFDGDELRARLRAAEEDPETQEHARSSPLQGRGSPFLVVESGFTFKGSSGSSGSTCLGKVELGVWRGGGCRRN